jgi:glycosyltransferase involved in cell wall biosynthesis
LAAGRPVVTTRNNGASELIEDDLSGAVVADPADDLVLAAACQEALGMASGFSEQVPELDEWVARMAAVMEQAGKEGAS